MKSMDVHEEIVLVTAEETRDNSELEDADVV